MDTSSPFTFPSRPLLSTILLAVALCLCPAAHAVLVMLDVEGDSSTTQAGFTRMTGAGMTGTAANGAFTPTATVDGITVTAAGGILQYRDRGTAGLLFPPHSEPYVNLLQEFIGKDGDDASINVTISGLSAGYYNITSFHHDWNVWATAKFFDILVSDADGTNQLKMDDAFFASTQNPYLGETYSIHADGLNDVVLTFVEQGTASTAPVRFNGLILASVPEPSKGVLALMGAAGILGVRRRRKA